VEYLFFIRLDVEPMTLIVDPGFLKMHEPALVDKALSLHRYQSKRRRKTRFKTLHIAGMLERLTLRFRSYKLSASVQLLVI